MIPKMLKCISRRETNYTVYSCQTSRCRFVVVFKVNDHLMHLNLSRNQLGELKTGSLFQQALG